MTRKTPELLCLLLAMLTAGWALPVQAGEPVARPKADWKKRHEEIAALRAQAKQIRAAALQAYNTESEQCREQTFSASACIERAKKKRIAAEREAVVLEQRVKTIKKTNRKNVQDAKKANEEERAKSQVSASRKQEINEQHRREKIQLQLDKLRGGQALAPLPGPPEVKQP